MFEKNQIVENNKGQKVKVIERNKLKNGYKSYWDVMFIESGYITPVRQNHLREGSFKDYGSPTVYGVGYSYSGARSANPKLYTTWKDMIRRCYDPKCKDYKNYGGAGLLYLKSGFITGISRGMLSTYSISANI